MFIAFLKLGLTSFGGPIAHLGYFRDEIVLRRRWLGEAAYADLVALCQFLPGPASSQVAFALGLLRAGPLGAMAAWAGFTLPSAILMTLFGLLAFTVEGPVATGLLHGLKIVAVAVVAQAVWGMARTLVPDRTRAAILLGALAIVVAAPTAWGQVVAIGAGALAGLFLCRSAEEAPAGHLAFPASRRTGVASLAAFFVLLIGLPLLQSATGSHAVAFVDAFYRAGALVFGGGHVVLPLLEAGTVQPGWMDRGSFLAGYGAAQAVPGPLFTFSAYLGAAAQPPPNGIAGAALALVAIFLPGLLLVAGALPFWDAFRTRPAAQAAMRGANAAVVGILAAALYDPVWTGAIADGRDFALAAACLLLLLVWKAPPVLVVVVAASGGLALSLLR